MPDITEAAKQLWSDLNKTGVKPMERYEVIDRYFREQRANAVRRLISDTDIELRRLDGVEWEEVARREHWLSAKVDEIEEGDA